MGSVVPSYTHIFLVIILVSFGRLDAAIEPCPTPCHCTLEILNCSKTNFPGLQRVPFPKPYGHPRVFFFLDFTDNAISSIGKQEWRAYPWAEYLILKGNTLSILQSTSLDGLLSLTHLDISCNKITTIEKNAFEPVPFLQFINLSGNFIGQITQGTFEAWHGMQFLLKIILTHNPLKGIEDTYFYKLPSLKFLDLGATNIAQNVLTDLLKTSLQLKILVLPKEMACCLCQIQNDLNVVCEKVKLNCTEPCDMNSTLCDTEGTLKNMQNELMNVLGTRKQKTNNILTILPEKPVKGNSTLTLTATQGLSHFGIHFSNITPHLFTTVKQLSKLKADDFMDVKWADKSELQKLYMLAKLLEAALKEKIAEYQKESEETEDENKELDTTEAPLLREKRHFEKVQRENPWGDIPRQLESLPRVGLDGGEFPKAVLRQDAERRGSLGLHRRIKSRQRKLPWGLPPRSLASLLRPHRAVLQSSWKRSVSESATGSPPLTASIVVDKKPEDDLTGKVVIILKHTNKSKMSNNEELQPPAEEQEEEASSGQNYPSESQPGPSSNIPNRENSENQMPVNMPGRGNSDNFMPVRKLNAQTLQMGQDFPQLMQKEDMSQMTADNTGTLNQLSPDMTLSQERPWAGTLPSGDDYLRQGDLFEAKLNNRLKSLIPNVPVRNLISHVIRILKMDCGEPNIQEACAKLISRTGLLMKLFSERENITETSSLWKSYFWPPKNEGNLSTANPRAMGKPSDEIARQGIPDYGYGNKLLLVISVTAVIMAITAIICLIEICSQRAAKLRGSSSEEERSFLGRRKSGEEKLGSTASLDKPLWLQDMYQPLDDARRKSMVDQLRDEDSLEGDDVVKWARSRPSFTSTPLPSDKRSSIKVEAAAAPPPEEPLVKKASSKKLSLPGPPPPPPPPPPAPASEGGTSTPEGASAPSDEEGDASKTKSGEEGSEAGEDASKKETSEGEAEEEEEEEEED